MRLANWLSAALELPKGPCLAPAALRVAEAHQETEPCTLDRSHCQYRKSAFNEVVLRDMRSLFGWSLSNPVALLRQQLFVYRHLMTWLNHPFESPPELYAAEQLALEWA